MNTLKIGDIVKAKGKTSEYVIEKLITTHKQKRAFISLRAYPQISKLTRLNVRQSDLTLVLL